MRAWLAALVLALGADAAQAQGMFTPFAPANGMIMGRPSDCDPASALNPYNRDVRRGQPSDAANSPPADPNAKPACPPR
jgi:hypothetical protein